MQKDLIRYEKYLLEEKKMAPNSIAAYKRDLAGFQIFLVQRGIDGWQHVNNTLVVSFVLFLKEEKKSVATVNRKIVAIRGLYSFLLDNGAVNVNPAIQVKPFKSEKKSPEFLSVKEVEILLSQPDDSTKGLRDRAILELLYATGMRVSELVELNLKDVNVRMGFVVCVNQDGKSRIIPVGRPAREALEEYLDDSRVDFLKDQQEPSLFVNYSGGRLTRQGLWKIIKHYAEKAKIKRKITPQILRHSFAMHMVQNGADLKSLQELLGHDDVTATQVYLIASKNRIKEVYDKTHPRA